MKDLLPGLAVAYWALLLLGAAAALIFPSLSAQTVDWFGGRTLPLTTFALAVGVITFAPLLSVAALLSGDVVRIDPLLPVWLGISCLGFAGAIEGQITFAGAALIVALAGAAFTTVWLLVLALWRGEAIELESRWGGVGGDLGGWRLSRSASLALLAAVLIGASIAMLSSRGTPAAPAANEAAKSAGKAGAGEGASTVTPKKAD